MDPDRNRMQRIETIIAGYGCGASSGMPDRAAWAVVAALREDQPVTLINFFAFRDIAQYHGASDDPEPVSGETAFGRYTDVSLGCVTEVGGHFLLVAPFGHGFIGPREHFDLAAIATYPSIENLLGLYELAEYRRAYPHRTAACRDQRVSLCLGG